MENQKNTVTKAKEPVKKVSDLVTGRAPTTPATERAPSYRDQFITAGNEILNEMALAADLRHPGTPLPFRFMVERVEGWNKVRLNKKSGATLYRLIQTEVSRRLGDNDAAKIVAEEVIKKAKAKAMGMKPEEVKEEVPRRAFIFGANFNRLMETVKAGVSTSPTRKDNDPAKMVSLTFAQEENGDASVTAFSCDGFRIIKTKGKAVVEAGAEFTVYIRIPVIKPKKTDMVSIALNGNIATVEFDNVSFRYEQPKEDAERKNFKELFDEQEKALTTKAVALVNPAYLRELARSLEKSDTVTKSPIEIVIQDGNDKLIKMTRGRTEVYLCPVRRHNDH